MLLINGLRLADSLHSWLVPVCADCRLGFKCFTVLDPRSGFIIVFYHPHSAIPCQHCVDLCQKKKKERKWLLKVQGLKYLKYDGTGFTLGRLPLRTFNFNS